jgi:hypothetical protein
MSLRRSAALLMSLAMLPGVLRPVAAAEPLFVLEDVKGDDFGSGALIYPNRPDMKPGDLDLVQLSAEQRGDTVWFTVELARPIRGTAGRVTELGQTPIERLARHGFYTFNVDIYIDTDRITGAGAVETLPGRGVRVDRNFAWEKAIVLTPRPDIARTMLQMNFDAEYETDLVAKQGRVSKEELGALQARSEQHVADRYYFPDRIRVSGRKIEFAVPLEFLGGVPAQSWAYTVLVTGADIEQTSRPGQISSRRPAMMTMPVSRGLSANQWGIRGDTDRNVPPVVDLLAPDPNTQPSVLDDYDTVAGRLASVPGVAPDGSASVAPTGQLLTVEQTQRLDAAASGAASRDRASGTVEKRAAPARLRTLNQLLEEGLITQDEYNELRRKILSEL